MENVEFICKWQENIMVDGDSWFNSLGPERVLAVVKRMYNLASCSSSPIVQKQAKINFLNETVAGLTNNEKSRYGISHCRNTF